MSHKLSLTKCCERKQHCDSRCWLLWRCAAPSVFEVILKFWMYFANWPLTSIISPHLMRFGKLSRSVFPSFLEFPLSSCLHSSPSVSISVLYALLVVRKCHVTGTYPESRQGPCGQLQRSKPPLSAVTPVTTVWTDSLFRFPAAGDVSWKLQVIFPWLETALPPFSIYHIQYRPTYSPFLLWILLQVALAVTERNWCNISIGH